jgi:hypothetical protein
MQGELRRMFVSLIGFLNIVGAMNGQPQLDFDIEKEGATQIIATRYLPDEKEKDALDARINFNFSPSVAFTGDLVIIATTESLARELMQSAAGDAGNADGKRRTNAAISIRAQALRDVLADNRQHLVAQNMLEEGHTKEEAERQVATLLAIIDVLRDGGAKLEVGDERIEFELQVRLKPIE